MATNTILETGQQVNPVTHTIALQWATLAAAGQYAPLRESVLAHTVNAGTGWQAMAAKFVRFLETGNPEFMVFAKGNSKLPFYAFSAAPMVTCPGMGSCGKYCYSLKAWRYPAALFRQLQNTILLTTQEGRATLAAEFLALPDDITLRLYVDGDFDSLRTMEFWFKLLGSRQDVQAYGYSKSWPLFLAWNDKGKAFPANYVLNLSSGSRYGQAYLARMTALPCVRGEFIAVPIPKGTPKAGLDYKRAVREAAKAAGYERSFVCPGKCGECTERGHACGLDNFNRVAIAIGIH